VAFPPGRFRLATRPVFTGSEPTTKTIGIVEVAVLTIRAAAPPAATITSTFRRTRSAAKSGNLSDCPFAQRYSMATFCPSTNPVFSQSLAPAGQRSRNRIGRPNVKEPDRRILSIGGERPCGNPAENCDEISPPHRPPNQADNWTLSHRWDYVVRHRNMGLRTSLTGHKLP
jgi:hypothetical protein